MDILVYKEAMSRFPSGVTLISCHDGKKPYGMTLSAFCSVSVAPPMILICVDKRGRMNETLKHHSTFGVSILSDQQSEVGKAFSQKDHDSSALFNQFGYFNNKEGDPILKDCISWLSCQIAQYHDVGDHTVFFGLVKDCGLGETKDPILYHQRTWKKLV